MKKLLMTVVVTAMTGMPFALYAAEVPAPTSPFPIVNWSSRGDEIKIENGNGANIMIQITVNGTENSPGIVIKNCGQTTAIKAGSSAICHTVDAKNPVTFTSDNKTDAAFGTYQIKQQQ